MIKVTGCCIGGRESVLGGSGFFYANIFRSRHFGSLPTCGQLESTLDQWSLMLVPRSYCEAGILSGSVKVFKKWFCGPRKILPYVLRKSFYAAFGKYSTCIIQLISLTVHQVKNWNYPCTGLDGPLGLQEVEAVTINRQWAHEGGKFFSYTHRPPLPLGEKSGTYFY